MKNLTHWGFRSWGQTWSWIWTWTIPCLLWGDDLGGELNLGEVEEEELVDPVDLAAEYNLDDPVRMYLKEIGQVKLLSADEEVELAKRVASGDKAARTSSQKPTSAWWSPLQRSTPAVVCTFWT